MDVSDFTRQTFLGPSFSSICTRLRIGVIGLGGGGSHIVQQLAYIGFLNYVLVDNQKIEASNLNRLIGASAIDVMMEIPKAQIAERTIRAIRPTASIERIQESWHSALRTLKECDVIFGCLDKFSERQMLEAVCRRYRIPLIDIGMTVKEASSPDDYWVGGQVIVSLPGHPCMRCMGYLSEDTMRREAVDYDDAGAEPQVVWANGVLASSAVGMLVALVSDWNANGVKPLYLEYDGNLHIVRESHISRALHGRECTHYPEDQVGDVELR